MPEVDDLNALPPLIDAVVDADGSMQDGAHRAPPRGRNPDMRKGAEDFGVIEEPVAETRRRGGVFRRDVLEYLDPPRPVAKRLL